MAEFDSQKERTLKRISDSLTTLIISDLLPMADRVEPEHLQELYSSHDFARFRRALHDTVARSVASAPTEGEFQERLRDLESNIRVLIQERRKEQKLSKYLGRAGILATMAAAVLALLVPTSVVLTLAVVGGLSSLAGFIGETMWEDRMRREADEISNALMQKLLKPRDSQS